MPVLHSTLIVEPGPGTTFHTHGAVTEGTAEITAFSSKHYGLSAAHVFLVIKSGPLAEYRVRFIDESDESVNQNGNIVLDSEDDLLVLVEPIQN